MPARLKTNAAQMAEETIASNAQKDVEEAKAAKEAVQGGAPKVKSGEAEALLQMIADRKEQAKIEEAKRDDQDYQFYMRDGSRGHIGIFFTRNPLVGEPIAMNEWFSTYKGTDDVYLGDVVCQQCLDIDGARRRLDIEYVDKLKGTFRPARRHVWKIAKDPERAEREGPFRAADLPEESNNLERHAILAAAES